MLLPDQARATLARYRTAVLACAVMNLRQAARSVTAQFDAQLRPAGLRATQLNLLMAIETEAAGSITQLAEILAMDRTTLTRNLMLLRNRGLVTKKGLVLTEKGRRAAAVALPLWAEAQDRIVNSLGEPRWAALLKELAAAKASVDSR